MFIEEASEDEGGEGGPDTPPDISVMPAPMATMGSDTVLNICRVCGDPIYKTTGGLRIGSKMWFHHPSNLGKCSLREPLRHFDATPAVDIDYNQEDD